MLITDECGIKIKPDTIDRMSDNIANALLKLKNDANLRKYMGDNGLHRVCEEFLVSDKYTKIINMLESKKNIKNNKKENLQ